MFLILLKENADQSWIMCPFSFICTHGLHHLTFTYLLFISATLIGCPTRHIRLLNLFLKMSKSYSCKWKTFPRLTFCLMSQLSLPSVCTKINHINLLMLKMFFHCTEMKPKLTHIKSSPSLLTCSAHIHFPDSWYYFSELFASKSPLSKNLNLLGKLRKSIQITE